MEAYLERPYDYRGRICDETELPHEVRLDDPSLTTLPPNQSKARLLDIRGTSIVELPRGTRFLHIRTDYFIWSPKPRSLMTEISIPQTVFSTMRGRRVGDLIEHPILKQLGVDKRYFKDVEQVGKYVICSVVKRRPSQQQVGVPQPI